jgi:shikimate dehydrogenase
MAEKSFAVLGDPLSHSLSPKIHSAAYEYLGIDYSYEAIRVPAGELGAFLQSEGASFDGFSVTMPLKFEAASIAGESNLFGTGACNTLVRTDTGLDGFNTDIAGIQFALSECLATRPESAAVLGSGATARSAIVAFVQSGIKIITVYARDTQKASELLGFLQLEAAELTVANLSEYGATEDVTVNTIAAGADAKYSLIKASSGWLLSANYAEVDNELSGSFASGRFVSGKEMLIGQAIEQIRHFVGTDIDAHSLDGAELATVMRSALS